MNTEKRIIAFSKLGDYLIESSPELQEIIHKAFVYNSWFTVDNTNRALQNITSEFLNKGKLEQWINKYDAIQLNLDSAKDNSTKNIAVVAAGNIPLVAFHDILCVLILGYQLQLKLSDKDKFLLQFLLDKLTKIEPDFQGKIAIKDRLENFDAIIATGSNNAAKHFEYYFGKYKNIIRRNRNSIAILNGNETTAELELLGHDIFDYFGLGCRNVSKLFVPENYDLIRLKAGFEKYKSIMQHTQYMNNLDYQRTLYLMNQTPLLDIDFINIVENNSLHSAISCLHVERYNSIDDVHHFIIEQKDNLQCIIGIDYLPFGKSQQPALSDYADNVDTIDFLLSL